MKLFCVFDVKAKAYMKPFVDVSTANAIRGFDNIANEKGSTFNKFPDDFALMEMGEFDPQTGKFNIAEFPYNHGTARSVIRTSEVVQ